MLNALEGCKAEFVIVDCDGAVMVGACCVAKSKLDIPPVVPVPPVPVRVVAPVDPVVVLPVVPVVPVVVWAKAPLAKKVEIAAAQRVRCRFRIP